MCLSSEIQPLETRAAGSAINVSSNMLFTFVIGQSFTTMLCSMRYGVFLFFAGERSGCLSWRDTLEKTLLLTCMSLGPQGPDTTACQWRARTQAHILQKLCGLGAGPRFVTARVWHGSA